MVEDEVFGTLQDDDDRGIDTTEAEGKLKEGASKLYQNIRVTTGGGATMWLVILILIIIGVALLWWVGSAIAGFFFTPMGMLCIVMFVAAIGIYLYMRQQGIGLKGWLGGIAEVALIFAGIFIFVGLSDALTELFFMAMPIVFLAALGWLGWRGIKSIKDEGLQKFAAVAIVIGIVAIPAYEFTLGQQTFGEALDIKIQVSRSDANAYRIVGVLQPPMAVQTMTTSLNPFFYAGFEVSNLMWRMNTQDKVFMDIIVSKHTGEPDVLYQEMAKPIYISLDQEKNVWGLVRVPWQPTYAEYELYTKVYDTAGITLAESRFVYMTGME